MKNLIKNLAYKKMFCNGKWYPRWQRYYWFGSYRSRCRVINPVIVWIKIKAWVKFNIIGDKESEVYLKRYKPKV